MKKKEILEVKNKTLYDFEICFRCKVHKENELRMNGNVGKITGNYFWVRYFPEQMNLINFREFWYPTILRGYIYEEDNGIKIEYCYEKKKQSGYFF